MAFSGHILGCKLATLREVYDTISTRLENLENMGEKSRSQSWSFQ